jgi:hypothetical protein
MIKGQKLFINKENYSKDNKGIYIDGDSDQILSKLIELLM